MFVEILLAAWSLAGLTWWLISWRLVLQANRPGNSPSNSPLLPSTQSGPISFLTVFKPLPPLSGKWDTLAEATLESFIAQLDANSELLLGIHEPDRAITSSFVARMRERHPAAQLRTIYRAEPDAYANPKISWLKILSPHAHGSLWLWSDADIVAPITFLANARAEFATSGVNMMTFPYVVREAKTAPALLDALFVNAEFYPGVLLLGSRGTVDFGLGAAMLFSKDEFLKRVAWPDLGEALADDFVLGQKMQPVRVGEATLVTRAEAATWKDALLHHLRWSKTILWNRPGGFAGRIMVLPLLGWLIDIAAQPAHWTGWIGALSMTQLDVVFAVLICRQLGLGFGIREIICTEFWSLWRTFVWLICWLPWPVIWRGQCWWTPRART